MIGAAAGSYRVIGKISEGGMGAVYRAEHSLIGKVAAVKVLLPELSMNRDVVARFFDEARATTQIRHPGIVEVYDFGYLPSGQAYLVMELLEGEPLSQRIACRGRMGESESAHIVRAVCGALAAAHAKGIVHRDLKPDNIYLVTDPEIGERPKLLDFGIAKLAHGQDPSNKTRTGTVMGTPTYMSPEQCRGAGDVDHRADLYALGCILYEMVCGRPPFVAEGAGEVIAAHQLVEPDRPRKHAPGLSAEMDRLLLRLLAKRPEDRVQTASELANALTPIAGRFPSSPGVLAAASQPTVIAAGGMPRRRKAPAPTTLSGSTGQTVRLADRRRHGWVLAVAAAGLIGAGAAVIVSRANRVAEPAAVPAAEPPAAAPAPLPPVFPPELGPPLVLPGAPSVSPTPARAIAPPPAAAVDAGVPEPAKPPPARPAKRRPAAKPAPKPPAPAAPTKGSKVPIERDL